MSNIKVRPVDGKSVIEVTITELEIFSAKMRLEYIDKIIPMPEISFMVQMNNILECNCNNQINWISDNGLKGLCCFSISLRMRST